MQGGYKFGSHQSGQKASEIEQGAQDEEVAERQTADVSRDAMIQAIGYGKITADNAVDALRRLDAAGFKIVAK